MERAEEFQNLQAQLQNLLIQKEALKLQKFELEKLKVDFETKYWKCEEYSIWILLHQYFTEHLYD